MEASVVVRSSVFCVILSIFVNVLYQVCRLFVHFFVTHMHEDACKRARARVPASECSPQYRRDHFSHRFWAAFFIDFGLVFRFLLILNPFLE